MVPLKKKQGHIFNRNKKQTCISINPFQGPRFLSYRQAELLQEPALGLHLVHAAQQCSGSHLSTCSTVSLKSFQVPKSTLWRERKVPQSLPSSHNFDLGPTASAHATFSSATLLAGHVSRFPVPMPLLMIFPAAAKSFVLRPPNQSLSKKMYPFFKVQFRHHTLQRAFQSLRPLHSLRGARTSSPEHTLPDTAGTQMVPVPCCDACSLPSTDGTLLLFIDTPKANTHLKLCIILPYIITLSFMCLYIFCGYTKKPNANNNIKKEKLCLFLLWKNNSNKCS